MHTSKNYMNIKKKQKELENIDKARFTNISVSIETLDSIPQVNKIY